MALELVDLKALELVCLMALGSVGLMEASMALGLAKAKEEQLVLSLAPLSSFYTLHLHHKDQSNKIDVFHSNLHQVEHSYSDMSRLLHRHPSSKCD